MLFTRFSRQAVGSAMRPFFVGLAGVFLVLAAPIAPGLPDCTVFAADFQGLGDLSGGGFSSIATGISADGSVVVGYGVNASYIEAFRWTQAGGMVGLGQLPGGSENNYAQGVSADGSVVVGRCYSTWWEPFRWTASSGMVSLGELPGGALGSDAYGVSADGSVVVGMGEGYSGQEAFRWTASGGMVGLGFLAGGSISHAYGASNNGSVIVGDSESASGYEAFRWTASGGMVGLGDLPGGAFSSSASGVSADGSVVVGTGHCDSGYEAFRWTASDGIVGLGDLPGGAFSSSASGVSADGSIIVGKGNDATGNAAFVWDKIRGMQNLHDLLVNEFGLTNLTGWNLYEATAISSDGLVIVGEGTNSSGDYEAWRVNLDGGTRSWVGTWDTSWDEPGNWSKWGKPGPQTTVLINPDSTYSIIGPKAAATIESLTVGARQSGVATLTLEGPSLHISNDILIQARGKLEQNSGDVLANALQNDGIFIQAQDTALRLNTIWNAGTATLGGGTYATDSIENFGTMTIQSGAIVELGFEDGPIASFINFGMLTMEGGNLYSNSNSYLTNEAGGQMIARGTIYSTLNNYGTITVSGTLNTNSTCSNYAQIDIASGYSILGGGPFYNYGNINLDGGGIGGYRGVQNYPGGAIQGFGSVTAALVGNQGGLIYANGGLLTIPWLTSNSNGGELRVGAGSSLNISCDFSSSGWITLEAQSARLGGGKITNSGSLVGCGQVSNVVDNSGVIRAENGQLMLTGTTTNATTGRVEILDGSTLAVTQGLSSNAGQIALDGGTFDNNGRTITNTVTGTILGHGNFRSGGLTNQGNVSFADYTTTVYGSVINQSGAKLYTYGTTTTLATFFGPVTNNAGAEIKINGGVVRFLAGLTNSGTYTSDPADNYIYNLAVTNTGILQGGAGDRFFLTGSCANAGTILLGDGSKATVQNGTGDLFQTAGSLTIGNGTTLTAGTLHIDGGTIAAGGPTALVTANLDYTSPTNNTFAGNLSGSGKTLTLNSAPTTKLILTNPNAYTGATIVESGILELSALGQIADSSAVTTASSGVFHINSGTHTVKKIDGQGTTVVTAGSLTTSSIVQSTLIIGGGLGAGAAVPEPSTLILLSISALGLLAYIRGKKRCNL